MTEWKLPWSASCLCKRVKMRVTAPPLIAMACHCTGCQKLTSGPYSLGFMLPGDGLDLLEGDTVLGGEHRPESQHHYCPHCKSWVFTKSQRLGSLVNLRATMLDDASWVVQFIESWTLEKLPGVTSGAKHSFDRFPETSQFPDLVAAYARDGVRPG